MSYRPGLNWAICDRCGFKRYAQDMKKTWDGWLVCRECWEPKHPSLSPPKLQPDRVKAKDARLPVEYFIEPEE